MELEVEKNLAPGSNQVADDLRPFGGIELQAHLVEAGGIAHGRHDLLGGGRGRNIQSDYETRTRIMHPEECKGDYCRRATGRNTATV